MAGLTMFNIEIITKIMIDDFVNIINCNVYDSEKNLIKANAFGTHYLQNNSVKLMNFDVANGDKNNIVDLCDNKVVFHFVNLRGLTFENR